MCAKALVQKAANIVRNLGRSPVLVPRLRAGGGDRKEDSAERKAGLRAQLEAWASARQQGSRLQ